MQLPDTKLYFKQARVRNTRAALRKVNAFFLDFAQTDFPGKTKTHEYYRNLCKLRDLTGTLKEVERELARHNLKRRMKKVG